MELTQVEADNLIRMDKKRTSNHSHIFPTPGTHTIVPLVSTDNTVESTINFYHAIIK